MNLTVKQAKILHEKLLPWGQRIADVFPGGTYAVQQTWLRDGKRVRQAVPAAWFQNRRHIETAADFLPFTAEIAAQHLLGFGPNRLGRWEPMKVGVYPMHPGSLVRFCAADFDIHQEKDESDEAFAARRTAGFPKLLHMACGIPAVARKFGISVTIEISASGSGIHVWLFFSELIPAARARRLLWRLLCAAGVAKQMMKGLEGKAKFDALFPKQDTVAELSPGNLIYLPYFEFGRRVLFGNVEPRSVFIDADAINDASDLDEKPPPVIRLSEFLARMVQHTSSEVDAALATLAAAGHLEEPPDAKLAVHSQVRRAEAKRGGDHPKFAEVNQHYSDDWRRVDWRRFLRDFGIGFNEARDGILRLTDGCPACGEFRHQAWVNAATGFLNCFSTNCRAHRDSGGMAPSRWCGLYGLQTPGSKS